LIDTSYTRMNLKVIRRHKFFTSVTVYILQCTVTAVSYVCVIDE